MEHVLDICDPDTYVDSQGVSELENAITIEISYLKKNHTWELVLRPLGKNVVKCCWV